MAAFIGFIKDYWGGIVGVAGFFFGWVKFTAAKAYASKEDVSKLEHRVSAVEQSITDVIKDAYDAALKVLRNIAKGDLLLSDPEGTPPEQGAPLVIVGGAERLFKQNSMKGF